MKLSKYAVLFVALLAVGCSRSSEDYIDEDYEKLFPFPGIEKPKISYEDQVVQLGDPDAPVSDYVYPGVEITENVRTYKVTLTCSFKEVNIEGSLVPAKSSAISTLKSSFARLPATRTTKRLTPFSTTQRIIHSPSRLSRATPCTFVSMV